MKLRPLLIAIPLFLGGTILPFSGAAASSPRHTAHSASPKALSLTLADVRRAYGSSFRPFMAHTYQASKKGACGGHYSGGYLAMFGNFAKATGGRAVVSVESAVFAYSNASEPACAFRATHSPPAHVAGTKLHTSSLGGIGDKASLTTADSPANRSYTLQISFYRGTHTGMVMVSGHGGRPAQAGVIQLAKVLDQRIQLAG